MAGSFTCDWCGHAIEDFSALNKMLCYGLPAGNREWHLHRPGDGYECMERAVQAFDEICGTDRPHPVKTTIAATPGGSYRAWRLLSPTEQEHQIFNVLGTDTQRPRDIASKINAMGDWYVWSEHVKAILDQMTERGDVQRSKQPRRPGSSQHWWMYCRSSQPLSPELEALERSLNGDEAAA